MAKDDEDFDFDSEDEIDFDEDFDSEEDHDANQELDDDEDFSNYDENKSLLSKILEKHKKTIIIGGGVALGIFILVFLYVLFSGPSEPLIEAIPLEKPKVVMIPKAEAIITPMQEDTENFVTDTAATNLVVEKPIEQDNKQVDSFAFEQHEIEHKQEINYVQKNLNDLSEEVTVNSNQVNQIKEIMIELKNSLVEVNNTLAGMNNRMHGIGNTVDKLRDDLENVKKIIKDEDLDLTGAGAADEETLTYSAPDYTVHAIIPGRAWLKTDEGQIITVTEGDKLGDYGTVSAIDSGNGIVRTSSGVTFR